MCVCVDVKIEKVCMGSREKEKEALDVFQVIVYAHLFKRQQKSVNIIPFAWRCCCMCIVTYISVMQFSMFSAQEVLTWKARTVWQPAHLRLSSLHGAACCPTCRSPQKQNAVVQARNQKHSLHASLIYGKT